jgi:hypothetical protein
LEKPDNVVILKEKMVEKNMELDSIELFEKNILIESNWKLNLISTMEIMILIFKFLYKDNFNINNITDSEPKTIGIYLYQISMVYFRASINDFSIYSKFPEHIILLSSIFINLNDKGENKKLMKLQKEYSEEIEEIQECIHLIENMVKNVFDENDSKNCEENITNEAEEIGDSFAKLFETEKGLNLVKS